MTQVCWFFWMQILACTGLHGIVRVVPWVFKVQEALVAGTSAAAVAEPSSVCVCVFVALCLCLPH